MTFICVSFRCGARGTGGSSARRAGADEIDIAAKIFCPIYASANME
jgi:hypothetical protein